MNLEQRIYEVVKEHCPQMNVANSLELTAFLTCECWIIINEYIHNLHKEQANNRRTSKRKDKNQ